MLISIRIRCRKIRGALVRLALRGRARNNVDFLPVLIVLEHAALGLVETHSIAWRYGCGQSARIMVGSCFWTVDGNT